MPQPAAAEIDSNTNSTAASLGGGELEHTIAAEVPTEEPEESATEEDDRGFYDEWVVDNGDNSIEELVDELAKEELDLDSTELAEKLREGLDPRKDS
jgi:hypothetical protein